MLRATATGLVGRLRAHVSTLLLASVAAGLAYLIASTVFDTAQAVFAPIAAVVATGLSAGQRRRRAVEISIGVVLGITAADLLSRWVGIGAWQLGAAVLLATTAAVAFRTSGLLSNQAAVAAVVVMTLVPLLDTGPWVRLGDALIGGAVAVVLSTLFSTTTFRAVSAVADRILFDYATVLSALRDDLAAGSLAGAEARLEETESMATARQELDDAAEAARERLVPTGSGTRADRRRTLDAGALLAERIVLLLTSARALCRAGANLVRHGRPVEPELLEAVDQLVAAVTALRGWISGEYDDDEVTRLALTAAATASQLYAVDSPPTVIVAVGQLRSAVVDVLRITGATQAEAVELLESAAGRAEFAAGRDDPGPFVGRVDRCAVGGLSTTFATMGTTSDIADNAEQMVNDSGGFHAQEQEPPGLTSEMTPLPDHGEHSYRGSGRLEGLKALITGGDSGIGRATAIAFAREGADVAISYMPVEQPDAEETASWIEKAGRKAVLLPADIRDEQQCRQMVRDAAGQLGGLDVLVNNAGYQHARGEGLETLDTENLDRVMKTNLYATFWASQEALEFLGRGSSIINTTSIQAYQPAPPLLDYASTKAALNNLTVNLANELGERGIRVNAVAPGPIWTPLQPATQDGQKLEKFGGDTPLGRAGQPGECAGAFVFLASPSDASYVSGTVLGVTGGKPIF